MSIVRRSAVLVLASVVLLIVGMSVHLLTRPDRLDPIQPESWVRPMGSPIYWLLWADVKEFIGEQRWEELDRSWMEEQARSDIARAQNESRYGDEAMFEGVWRLDVGRRGVRVAIKAREGAPLWPLGPKRRGEAWRPRLARWWDVQENPSVELHRRLDEEWIEAVAARDCDRMARVLYARAEFLDREPTGDQRYDAKAVVERFIQTSDEGQVPDGLVDLLELCGLPEGVDFEPYLREARHRYRSLENETIPLPHPYDLRLKIARLERLWDAHRAATRER